MTPDSEYLRTIDLDVATSLVYQEVYAATAFVEKLQRAGRLCGNGHHARQKIAQAAADELRARWVEPAAVAAGERA